MITLSSDFGSPYPAAMRGVILQRSEARLVDVTHELPRQDLRVAAFWLRELLPWFPPAVHLAVVDPGVGTDRAALVLRVGDHALVGPDNGSMVPVAREIARRVADEGERESGDVEPGGGGRPPIEPFRIDDSAARSSTFHGRDVFAPAAADVHEAGVENVAAVERIEPVDHYENLQLPEATVEEDRARGEVLAVDDFGNATTNVPGSAVAGRLSVRVEAGDTDERIPVGDTFEAVERGQRLVTVGSHGNVELDVNHGRGDEAFGIGAGDEVLLTW